jgi:hypothetical protein
LDDVPVDILIIGSGASGAAVAWRLSDAGFRIMCLEQGRWQKPEEYAPGFANWEFRAASNFHFNPNVRRLPEDYPVNDDDSAISPLMFNAVGGSTIHWTAHTPRFHPSDFRVRSLDGVADDWPLSYADLERYYDLNDAWMGCSGIPGDPANPPRSPRPMPPLPLGPDGERIARGFDRLDWHWWPVRLVHHVDALPGAGRLQQLRALRAGLPPEVERVDRCHLLADRHRQRRGTADRRARVRDRHRDRTAAPPGHATSTATARCGSSRPAR